MPGQESSVLPAAFRGTDPDPPSFYDDDCPLAEFVAVFFEGPVDRFPLFPSWETHDPHDSCMLDAAEHGQLAEVLVQGARTRSSR